MTKPSRIVLSKILPIHLSLKVKTKQMLANRPGPSSLQPFAKQAPLKKCCSISNCQVIGAFQKAVSYTTCNHCALTLLLPSYSPDDSHTNDKV